MVKLNFFSENRKIKLSMSEKTAMRILYTLLKQLKNRRTIANKSSKKRIKRTSSDKDGSTLTESAKSIVSVIDVYSSCL